MTRDQEGMNGERRERRNGITRENGEKGDDKRAGRKG